MCRLNPLCNCSASTTVAYRPCTALTHHILWLSSALSAKCAVLIHYATVVLGRALLGAAESFIITSGLAWGLALAGPANAGKVIAWVGMSMFAAFASGPPLGTALYNFGGFASIAIATMLIPLVTILLVASLASVPPRRAGRSHLLKVVGAVWMSGFGSALSSIGFGTMIAFSSLLSVERGWMPVWLLFTTFAAALVAARLFFGHLPDKLGGAWVALISAVIEAIGLALIWLAPSLFLAAAGGLLTGFGYALVYPGLGAEAVRRVPPESRGLAMGAYSTFLDVALGFGSPALGLIAGLLAISSGTKYLELASDEVDHRLEVVRRAVSAGLGLGSLHEAIDAFKDAVGDVGVVPAQDAVPVPLDGPGGIDHGLKAAMGRPEIPPLEEGLGVLT